MSELMDRAVIGMPYDMAMRDDWSRRQFYNRAQEILAELEVYRAAQQQAEPATHSEDGREVPEVEAYLIKWQLGNKTTTTTGLSAMSEEGLKNAHGELAHVLSNAPLMTVAQHSRIVAAKDAEIARWQSIAQKQWDKGDAQFAADIYRALDEVAQPARQVGAELEQIAAKIDSLEAASGFACGIGDELRALLGKES